MIATKTLMCLYLIFFHNMCATRYTYLFHKNKLLGYWINIIVMPKPFVKNKRLNTKPLTIFHRFQRTVGIIDFDLCGDHSQQVQ